METLSFVLGMALVVVIALSIVAVIGFVKARKLETELEHISSDVYRQIDRNTTELHQRIDFESSSIHSQLDSRLDKLEQKLTNKK
jgi:CHASE1-domain containing sensor protein